ncbi:AAA family ATPase [Desulfobacterales bacterium HSG17]|nr:AAA family ATPase [Desulfobacterales bacterium HSG17]
MIFKTITLYNLFSYYGKIVFKLNDSKENKNIILIAGRNGHGKTSFINSIKLLFSGPSNELRSNIPGSAKQIGIKNYLLGTNLWAGVFNTKAKKEGQNKFYIKIKWKEDSGTVEATREWLMSGNDAYHENLEISFLEKTIKRNDAQEFLDERLPQDYIQFFYFDGEQINKPIDISQGFLQNHMERLLNISQIDTAREYIAKAESEWRKSAMVENENARLQELQHEQKQKNTAIASNIEKRSYLEDIITELEDEIENISKRLDRVREDSQIGNEKILKQEYNDTKDDIEKLTYSIADELTNDSPLLFNTEIITKVNDIIKIILESNTKAQSELINNLIKTFPTGLFDSAPFSDPPISQYQTDFYKQRLIQLLKAYKPVHNSQKKLFSIGKTRADKISEIIIPYLSVFHRKQSLSENLKKINHYKERIVEIKHILDGIPSLFQQEKEEFENAKKELSQKSEIKGEKEKEIKEINNNIILLNKEVKKLEQDIKHQEKQVKISGSAKNKVDLSQKLKSFFKNYKEEIKKKRREEIELKLNKYSQRLITSQKQIGKIILNDDFSLHPVNKNGEPIGINSLSSGMRQLIATALLWALKDVSRKMVPLVIDTPLGRIDKEHQENLLKYYYPSVGKQVIILPTDSELDMEKYKLLKPHICQEFQLRNYDGESTEYIEKPMYNIS